MKAIAISQRNLIDAIVTETGISPALLEKDIQVTDVLKALFQLKFDLCRFVFCGGTSLSKAHGVIHRMSEDIDIKIVMKNDHDLSRNAMRRYLRYVHIQIQQKMAAIGLEEDIKAKKVLNEYRYCSTSWRYQSEYHSSLALRPHLSVEFTVRNPEFPTTNRPINYLIEQFGAPTTTTTLIECIAIEETVAEKVLSFLRRYSTYRAGKLKQDWDEALVRHIYDIHCIQQCHPDISKKVTVRFPEVVAFDRHEFTEHQAFVDNPKACLFKALGMTEHDQKTEREYRLRLLPLIYGDVRPDFPTAFSSFKAVSQHLLNSL